jgi:hypothetical protein
MVWFASININTHGPHGYDFDAVEIAARIGHHRKKLPLIAVYSKNGGLHLFVFFKEPISATTARKILSTWARALGFRDVEIFPKQDAVSMTGAGSNLWMPYYGCCSLNAELPKQAAIDPFGRCLSVQDFIDEAQRKAITLEELLALELRPPGRPSGPESKNPQRRQYRYGTVEWAKSKLDEVCARETVRGGNTPQQRNDHFRQLQSPGSRDPVRGNTDQRIGEAAVTGAVGEHHCQQH